MAYRDLLINRLRTRLTEAPIAATVRAAALDALQAFGGAIWDEAAFIRAQAGVPDALWNARVRDDKNAAAITQTLTEYIQAVKVVEKQWYRVSEVVTVTGRPKSTIKWYLYLAPEDQRIPATLHGHTLLIKATDLWQWVAADERRQKEKEEKPQRGRPRKKLIVQS